MVQGKGTRARRIEAGRMVRKQGAKQEFEEQQGGRGSGEGMGKKQGAGRMVRRRDGAFGKVRC